MGGLLGASLLAIIGVPLVGIVLGLVQQRWYDARLKAGKVTEDDVPFFGILMLRGMVVAFAVLAALAIMANIQQPPKVNQPPVKTP
jgi:uncharacterized membrane protein YqjE